MAPNAQGLAQARECIHHLRPHLRAGDFAITGSLAMHLHGIRHRSALDVDLIAASIDVVEPSAAHSFLVSHYHSSTGTNPKFMVQLVDSLSRFRVDVFPDLEGSLERAKPHVFDGQTTLVVSASDILRHKLQTLRTAAQGRSVDPKHLDDARALASSLGETVPAFPSLQLGPDRFSTDVSQTCLRCRESLSSAFPLAPKQQILDLLGYV